MSNQVLNLNKYFVKVQHKRLPEILESELFNAKMED